MRIKVFVSHSFSNTDHIDTVAAFRNAVEAACEAVQRNCISNALGKVSLELCFEDREVGRSLPEQIRARIRDSDIFLIDISGRTPNTFYELGYAQALRIEAIIVQRKAQDISPIPSDITDLLVGFYDSLSRLQELLVLRFASITTRILREDTVSTRILRDRCIWFDSDIREIHIICGPEPELTRFAHFDADDFLFVDNFDDRDSLFEVSTFLSRAYPHAKLFRHTARNVAADVLESNLVLLGGPLTNDIARDMMRELKTRIDYIDKDDAIQFKGAESIDVVHSQKDSSGILIEDVGYFGRFRNPFSRKNRIVMCQGCHTFGTLAACIALSDSNQAQDNIKLLGKRRLIE